MDEEHCFALTKQVRVVCGMSFSEMSANSFNEATVEMNSDNWSDEVDEQSDDSYLGRAHATTTEKSRQNLPKKRERPSTAEKRRLAAFIKEERMLWDQSHAHYSDKRANDKAWERIASKMPGRTGMFFRQLFTLLFTITNQCLLQSKI